MPVLNGGRELSRQKRVSILENILLWEGNVSRSRIQELFGLSAVRASEWIRELRKEHPSWLVWDSKTKSYDASFEAYRASEKSKSKQDDSLSDYLALVGLPHAVSSESVQTRVVWSAYPDIATPRPDIFSAITEAILAHQKIEITYLSMREPKPHNRIISPHNLIRAGRRWHTRAFCSASQEFRDYALGRISDVKKLKEPSAGSEQEDTAWITKVPIRLIAHPQLTVDQQEVIKFEYFKNTAAQVITCRGALVGYFIQDLRAAVDINKQVPPEYQLAVQNIKEVKRWLFLE